MALITSGEAEIAPTLILGWENAATSPTLSTPLLDGTQVFIIRQGTPSSLPLKLLFENAADALAAFEALKITRPWTITGADTPLSNITFLVTGAMSIALDPATSRLWVITADVTEVV